MGLGLLRRCDHSFKHQVAGGAFVLEKLVYVVVWVGWMLENSLASVYSIDLFAGIFYSIYGLNDFVFMLFFAWLFVSRHQESIA